jgi:hypothetical protein
MADSQRSLVAAQATALLNHAHQGIVAAGRGGFKSSQTVLSAVTAASSNFELGQFPQQYRTSVNAPQITASDTFATCPVHHHACEQLLGICRTQLDAWSSSEGPVDLAARGKDLSFEFRKQLLVSGLIPDIHTLNFSHLRPMHCAATQCVTLLL